RAFGAMRAEHDDRDRLAAHDFFQRVDAVNAGHFQIKRDHVGLQLLDLLKAEGAIHRAAHNLDRFIGSQHLRDQLAHERRVVGDQNADFLHAWPPTGGVSARRVRSVWVSSSPEPARPISCGRKCATCSTTAERFRISTTRPSPRMEAPDTRSVENVWSSRALITSSSSPSSASTIKPYFLSPTVITSTNSLELRPGSPAGRPSRSTGRT